MSDTRESGTLGPDGVRLFAFHHAGGSHALYQGWRSRLPASWDVRLLDAPGHGKLFGHPQIDDLGDLAEYFLDQIGPELVEPYAFFGHSMGGMVAGEMAHRLTVRGLCGPVWLGLSSCRAPGHLPPVLRHTMSDEDLRRSVADLGGTPAVVLEDPTLWAIFGPIIRADMRVVESRRPEPTHPLPMPVSLFAGRDDTSITREQLTDWTRFCADYRGLRLFDGGHFYFSADPGPLLEQVIQEVRAALGAVSDPTR